PRRARDRDRGRLGAGDRSAVAARRGAARHLRSRHPPLVPSGRAGGCRPPLMTRVALDDRDGPRDECGVFGVYAPESDVARLAYFALFALQHRGQESAGIATTENGHIMTVR